MGKADITAWRKHSTGLLPMPRLTANVNNSSKSSTPTRTMSPVSQNTTSPPLPITRATERTAILTTTTPLRELKLTSTTKMTTTEINMPSSTATLFQLVMSNSHLTVCTRRTTQRRISRKRAMPICKEEIRTAAIMLDVRNRPPSLRRTTTLADPQVVQTDRECFGLLLS